MSNDRCSCSSACIDFKFDDISKKVAEKLSGISLNETVRKESKLFADNKIKKWFFDK